MIIHITSCLLCWI